MLQTEFLDSIARLKRQHSDDALVEAKACSVNLSTDVWESVSAFANTSGGALFLGVDESSNFSPTLGFDIDKIISQFVSGIGDGGEAGKLHNAPPYSIERHELEGRQVLVIEIEEIDIRLKPCYLLNRAIQNGSYKRVDDKDIRLSLTEIYEMQNALVPSDADGRVVEEARESDLEDQIVNDIISYELRHDARSVKGVTDRGEQMKRLRITDGKGGVRLAGILVAGSYPQQFFPKLVIDVTAHPGTEKSITNSPRFIDRKICEGPLPDAIDDALMAITRNLRTYSIIDGAGRRDELEIPLDVLREALANAVIHREYSDFFRGQAISVDIFPDRVAITNPGGLWGGKTKENLADGTSRCRNDSIMRLMSAVQLPDGSGVPAEGEGSGIPLMINEMKSRALKPPEFKPGIDSFTVVLSRGGAEIAENRRWISGRTSETLGPHGEALLLMARRGKSVTVAEAHNSLGLDSDEIRKIAAGLIESGLLVQYAPDVFRIPSEEGPATLDERLLAVLSLDTPKGMAELQAATGANITTIRRHIRKLIEQEKVRATAPPQSRNRKYLLR